MKYLISNKEAKNGLFLSKDNMITIYCDLHTSFTLNRAKKLTVALNYICPKNKYKIYKVSDTILVWEFHNGHYYKFRALKSTKLSDRFQLTKKKAYAKFYSNILENLEQKLVTVLEQIEAAS